MLGGGTGAGIPSWGCLGDHRGERLLTSPLPTAHLCPSHLGDPKTGETPRATEVAVGRSGSLQVSAPLSKLTGWVCGGFL